MSAQPNDRNADKEVLHRPHRRGMRQKYVILGLSVGLKLSVRGSKAFVDSHELRRPTSRFSRAAKSRRLQPLVGRHLGLTVELQAKECLALGIVPLLKLSVDKTMANNFQRCGHPGQQHGLRMPPRSLSMPTSMRRFLVSSFLADVTQQIHSFRASGVISVQRLSAAASDSIAFRKSSGSLCTVPCASF